MRRKLAVYQSESVTLLVKSFLHKVDYTAGVTTFRIYCKNSSNEFEYRLVENPIISAVTDVAMQAQGDENFASRGKTTKMKIGSADSDHILKNAIRNKKKFTEIIAEMPLPTIFQYSLLLSIFCTFAGFAASLYICISMGDLYDQILSGMNLMFLQANSVQTLIRTSSSLQQALGYNR